MTDVHPFCPVALASEILGRPWTPMVLRELLLGSVRFNDLHRGVPRMSRSLLSTRLDQLRDAGIVERRSVDGHPEYHLTPSGEELRPVVMAMGRWGKRWLRHDLTRGLDVGHLMWDLRRRWVFDAAPDGRLVIQFHFTDAHEGSRWFWLVVEDGSAEVCVDDPGHEPDLRLECEVAALVDVWMGDVDVRRALDDGSLQLRGAPALRREFPRWLGLSLLADVERQG